MNSLVALAPRISNDNGPENPEALPCPHKGGRRENRRPPGRPEQRAKSNQRHQNLPSSPRVSYTSASIPCAITSAASTRTCTSTRKSEWVGKALRQRLIR